MKQYNYYKKINININNQNQPYIKKLGQILFLLSFK